MKRQLSKKEQLVRLILDTQDQDDELEHEELMHQLLEKKVARDMAHVHEENSSLGARMSDKMAAVAGSWAFILSFAVLLAGWIVINVALLAHPVDPYPFILLNLILSCVAAIQAPIIMMSQNRQEEKDRVRSKNDYKVDLKSELIIEDLHYKIDRLIKNQEAILKHLNPAGKS